MQTLLSPQTNKQYTAFIYKSPTTQYEHFVNAFSYYNICTEGTPSKSKQQYTKLATVEWQQLTKNKVSSSQIDILIQKYTSATPKTVSLITTGSLLFLPIQTNQVIKTVDTSDTTLSTPTPHNNISVSDTTELPSSVSNTAKHSFIHVGNNKASFIHVGNNKASFIHVRNNKAPFSFIST
jgi:hypothetical protein